MTHKIQLPYTAMNLHKLVEIGWFHVEQFGRFISATMVTALSFLMITYLCTGPILAEPVSTDLKNHYKVGGTDAPQECLGEVTVVNPSTGKGRGRAIIVHGLNNNVDAMSDLESALSKLFYVEHLQLPGHGNSLCQGRDMQADWLAAYNDLVQRSGEPPSLSLGYSLGGLIIAAHTANKEYAITPKRTILIAPAIRLNYTRIPLQIGAFLLPSATLLPSFTPEQVRAFEDIPVSYYEGLRDLQSTLNENLATLKQRQTPTLVLLNREDRLISYERTNTFVARNFPTWIVRTVTPSEDASPADSHLIITRGSLGTGPWEKMKSEIYNFLEIAH